MLVRGRVVIGAIGSMPSVMIAVPWPGGANPRRGGKRSPGQTQESTQGQCEIRCKARALLSLVDVVDGDTRCAEFY